MQRRERRALCLRGIDAQTGHRGAGQLDAEHSDRRRNQHPDRGCRTLPQRSAASFLGVHR